MTVWPSASQTQPLLATPYGLWPRRPLTPYELRLRQEFISDDNETAERFVDWDDGSYDKAGLVERLEKMQ